VLPNASAPRGLRAAISASYAPALASIKTVVGLIDREVGIEGGGGGVLDPPRIVLATRNGRRRRPWGGLSRQPPLGAERRLL
jgi:hypothetical protein